LKNDELGLNGEVKSNRALLGKESRKKSRDYCMGRAGENSQSLG
jgi:hypothetical protein